MPPGRCVFIVDLAFFLYISNQAFFSVRETHAVRQCDIFLHLSTSEQAGAAVIKQQRSVTAPLRAVLSASKSDSILYRAFLF